MTEQEEQTALDAWKKAYIKSLVERRGMTEADAAAVVQKNIAALSQKHNISEKDATIMLQQQLQQQVAAVAQKAQQRPPAASLVDSLLADINTLSQAFNIKADKVAREQEQKKGAPLTPEERVALVDTAALKDIIDAKTKAVTAITSHEENERQWAVFQSMQKKPANGQKDRNIGFKSSPKPAAAPAA